MNKRKAEGPVVAVDAGNLLSPRAELRDKDRPQQEIKAKLLADGLALVGIDAMLPGAGDLALGASFVQSLAETDKLPYVAANLECGGKNPFPAARTFERGGVRFTVVGVEGNSVAEPTCHVTEPVAAAKAAVAANPADVVIVLSGQKASEDEALAAAIPAVSFVVNGQERQQLEQPKNLSNGGLLLAAGSRGKQLGVLSLQLTPGATKWRDSQVLDRYASQKEGYRNRAAELRTRLEKATDDATRDRLGKQIDFFDRKIAEVDASLKAAAADGGPSHRATNALVDMGADIADDPATAELVAKAKAAVEQAEPVAGASESAIATGPFAGSSACTGCHPAQAQQWSTTAHSRAYASLVTAGRERDRACFSCHVTGGLHPDGPHEPGEVAGLENVGCEACHGPGKAHIGNPPTVEMRTPDVTLCTGCHDGKQDEGRFDAATYLPQVVH